MLSVDSILFEGVILLGFGLVCVLVFRRLGLGSVLGYLAAGILIGPHGLRLLGGAQGKFDFAELGIAFLLFIVGLELSPRLLWRMKQNILGLGSAQVIACGIGLWLFIWAIADLSWSAALAVAMPLALSSTAQVLPALQSAGRVHTPVGERAFGILLFQDLALIPMMTIIAALSRAPVDPDAPTGLKLAGMTVAGVTALVVIGLLVIRPLLKSARKIGERELVTAVGLFTVVGSCGLMARFHLSPALGAFVAGVLLANSVERDAIRNDIEPFRTLLIGLFFIAIGMMLDPHLILERPLFVLGMAFGLIVIKTIILYPIARLSGLAPYAALVLGLLLSQGGEFGFVLFTRAQEAMLITREAGNLFGAIVTVSMATTPFLIQMLRRFEKRRPEFAPPRPASQPEVECG